MPDALTDYLFERTYEQVYPHGERRRITLQVGKPYLLDASDPIWRCGWRLVRADAVGRVNIAQGLDALDALLCALKLADALLKSYADPPSYQVFWQGDVPGTGLPGILVEAPEPPLLQVDDSVFEEVLKAFFRDYKTRRPSVDHPPE